MKASLLENEFKVWVIKILIELGKIINLRTESFLKTPRKYQGEGNGTPLQYSCLENSMDGRAWWAAVHGVTQSRT